MFKINYNDIKKSKKEYSNILKNTNINSYKLHEKMSFTLNHSIQSNISETTASKTNTNKTFCSAFNKLQVNEKSSIPKKFSYLAFLQLRKTKNSFPFTNKEKRFKWQNLKDESNVVYPEMYKKPHKKQHLLKETFGENIIGFGGRRREYQPRMRKARRSKSENKEFPDNHVLYADFEVSRRVILPYYNREINKICKRKALSQNNFMFHNTTGNIKTLFELTPIEVPIKGKKLFENKSYNALSINLFDEDYAQYEMPIHTKKQFFNNNCYFDNIKEESLISKMNKCWRVSKKRSKSSDTRDSRGFRSINEYYCNRNINNLNLRCYENCFYNKTDNNKNFNKIKRNNKNIKIY